MLRRLGAVGRLATGIPKIATGLQDAENQSNITQGTILIIMAK